MNLFFICFSYLQIIQSSFAQNITYPVYPSCGALGVVITANELGIPLTYEKLARQDDMQKDTLNFAEIIEGSKSYNIEFVGVKGGVEPLKNSSPPLIVAVTPEHFTVIRDIQSDGVITIENSGIESFESWKDFLPKFRQAALIVQDYTPPDDLPDTFLFYTQTADFGWVPSQPRIEYSGGKTGLLNPLPSSNCLPAADVLRLKSNRKPRNSVKKLW